MERFEFSTAQVTISGGRVAGPDPVLLVHGVTANHRAFDVLADRLPGRGIVAPDLRGRGGSRGHDGATGMTVHADDLVRTLDHLGVDRVPVVGHSMGGFVALVLAHRHPDRVSSLILIDGGMPLGAPDFTPAGSIDDVMTPIAARLAVTFPNRQAAVDAWRHHPAFKDDFTPAVEAYAEYDLDPVQPRSRVSLDAVRGDTEDLAGGRALLDAVAHVQHPVQWLVAPRGLLDETPGLYPPAAVDFWRAHVPDLGYHLVEDVNHYTILMSPRGADAVAQGVR